MPQTHRQPAIFRFAPSPNGRLHLGHALSAFLNHDMARAVEGTFLIRIEDIDRTRCTPELERGILEDLAWLGLSSDRPIRRQSDHLEDYQAALQRLAELGVTYPSFMTRGDVRNHVMAAQAEGLAWPRDPDGAPLYPAIDRLRDATEREARLKRGDRHAIRLDVEKAIAMAGPDLDWLETGEGVPRRVAANPAAWGDIVLSRSDAPGSYALSVVVDDAAQGVTHVVRGQDLYHATAIQRLLQVLLGLPEPVYHHHRLVLDEEGRKLSKSSNSTALAELRTQGLTPSDIRRLVSL